MRSSPNDKKGTGALVGTIAARVCIRRGDWYLGDEVDGRLQVAKGDL